MALILTLWAIAVAMVQKAPAMSALLPIRIILRFSIPIFPIF